MIHGELRWLLTPKHMKKLSESADICDDLKRNRTSIIEKYDTN